MKKDKLIYIMDPHCIRSYVNEEAVKELYQSLKDKYVFEVLPGGMWKKEIAPRGGDAIKEFLQPLIDRREKTQKNDISDSYQDLIQDSSYLMASDWPSQAIVAVNEIDEKETLDFAYALMKQQFGVGKRYDVEGTYLDAMDSIDMDFKEFKKVWKSDDMNAKTMKAFLRANKISTNFPSLVIEREDGFKIVRTGIFRAKEVEKELLEELDARISEYKVA